MRAHNDPWFVDFLLRVRDGTKEADGHENMQLPGQICVPCTRNETDLDGLIDHVFPGIDENITDPNYITYRAILLTKNENIDRIDIRMIQRLPGEEMVYRSSDLIEDDLHNHYQPKFLNSFTPSGLPPHLLKLKINCPIIMLHNIDPTNGLCNGTRLVVRGFQKNAIDAEIVLGQHVGKRVFLPRIPLCPSDDEMFPFKFKRKQFPVRLSFVRPVKKAQGQTIPNVGVYLPDPAFSHGQLYVALSRATARSHVKILIVKDKDGQAKSTKSRGTMKRNTDMPSNTDKSRWTRTRNIVYKEVLTT